MTLIDCGVSRIFSGSLVRDVRRAVTFTVSILFLPSSLLATTVWPNADVIAAADLIPKVASPNAWFARATNSPNL